ncbi:MAG: hypothetical protein P4L16_06700 [Chlamydiales bacterium]|nr:hypothetical protein [Chlamydiales bacterium]
MKYSLFLILMGTLLTTACHTRHIRTAYDATPGNLQESELDWRYGANDIRIQTTKLTRILMNRWFYKTGYSIATCGKPRIILTEIDNRTDMYISTDMIRDIFEGIAINDGRFIIVVGDKKDEKELDSLMCKQQEAQKYQNPSKLTPCMAITPEFLAKVRITKAITTTPCYDIEDYRMTLTLYDIETQTCIDQAFDILRKHVKP